MSLLMASRRDAVVPASIVRDAVSEFAPATAVGEARPLPAVVHDAQGVARVLTALLGLLSLLAVALGAVGLHGALAGWVAARRSEIGTRLALGAAPARLAGNVLAAGVALTCAGVGLGLIAAALVTTALRGLLFGVAPLDPIAFGMPPAVLVAIAAVAAAGPAFSAAAVAPADALKAG
jgi:ABC-type antimicrobial peptide transport system permease subunit